MPRTPAAVQSAVGAADKESGRSQELHPPLPAQPVLAAAPPAAAPPRAAASPPGAWHAPAAVACNLRCQQQGRKQNTDKPGSGHSVVREAAAVSSWGMPIRVEPPLQTTCLWRQLLLLLLAQGDQVRDVNEAAREEKASLIKHQGRCLSHAVGHDNSTAYRLV